MGLQYLSRSQLSDFLLGKLDPEMAAEVADYIENNPDVIERMLEDEKLLGSSVHSTTGTLASILNEPELGSGIHRTRQLPNQSELSPENGLALPSTAACPQTGMVVGEYLLTSVLSRRGRDSVYFASHQSTGEPVVIKCLGVGSEDSFNLRRFRRELSRYSRLEHPGIVKFKTTFEERAQLFLVMERLEGCDLSQVSQLCGPLSLAEASEIVKQVAETLGWLHQQRIVHRDVKPSNLYLTDCGVVKLIDFGLAHAFDIEESLTQSGQVLGTIDYMSPEQAFDSHGATAKSDIYSLGCTLFKLLTGQAPYAGRQYRHFLRKALAHASEAFPSARSLRPELPIEVDAILAKACAKKPKDRFRDANEFAAAMSAYANAAELAPLASRAVDLQTKPARSSEVVSRVEKGIASTLDFNRRGTRTSFLLPACLAALGVTGLVFWSVAGTNEKISAKTEQVSTRAVDVPAQAEGWAEKSAISQRLLTDFNTEGEFEHDSTAWTKVGEPLERANFVRAREKSFSGRSAMSSSPAVRGTGAGIALFYDVSGIVPGETYVLSACFETSEMSAGCLGVDLEGGSRGVRLTAQAAVSGWQFHWTEFTANAVSFRIRLVHDVELVPGERGYFDSVKVTPKAQFEPTKENASVTFGDFSRIRQAWKTWLPTTSSQQLLYDRKSSFFVTSASTTSLLLDISGWESRVWVPPRAVALPPETEVVGLTDGAEPLTLLSTGKLYRWGSDAGLVPVENANEGCRIIAASRDGNLVLRTNGESDVSAFDVSNLQEYRLPISANSSIASSCFSQDNRMVAVATENELQVFLLDAGAARQVANLPVGGIKSVTFSLDGKKLVASNSNSEIRSWQTNSFREDLVLEADFPHSGTLEVSADGKFALLGNSGGSLCLYDLTSGEALWSWLAVDGVFVSGNRFATLNRDGVLVGWQLPEE